MKKIFILFLLIAALTLSANEVFNGDFRLGTAGFAQKRAIRRDHNPNLEVPPLLVQNGSLLIRNPYGDVYEVISREFSLKPDTEYVFRFQARSSVRNDSVSGVLFSVSGKKWTTFHLKAELQNEFCTFERIIRTPKAGAAGWMVQFQPSVIAGTVPSSIAVKNVEVFEKGKPAAPRPEAAAAIPETLFVKEKNTEIPICLTIANGGEKQHFKGRLLITETRSGKTVFQRVAEAELEANQVKSWNFTFSPGHYGRYVVNAEIPGVNALGAQFAVIGKYVARPLKLDRDFCIGVNDGIYLEYLPKFPFKVYRAWGTSVPERFEMMAKMGCRLLRDHDAGYELASWYLLEPRENKWDFSDADFAFEFYRKYNFYLLPCIGRGHFLEPLKSQLRFAQKHWPDWLSGRCRRLTEFPPDTWGGIRGRIVLPPEPEWRNFVSHLAAHFKGKIQFYEIFNEPNGVMSAKDYLVYCRSAYEAIHKADPSAKVIGLCATEDHSITIDNFLAEFVAQKGDNFIDAASFHPYAARELRSVSPADRQIAKIRTALSANGKSVPVWNTELYYLFDTADRNSETQKWCTADQAAARLLTDLGEGVRQSSVFCFEQFWAPPRMLEKFWQADHKQAFCELAPSEIFVACNAFARLLEGATPVSRKKSSDGVILYLYKNREGRPLAALWNYLGTAGLSLDLAKFQVLDVYGNPVPGTGKPHPVTDSVFYLLPAPGMDDAAFVKAVQELSVQRKRPIRAGNRFRKIGDQIFATLYNDSARTQSRSIGFRGAGVRAKQLQDIVIPAQGHLNVSIKIEADVSMRNVPPEIISVGGIREERFPGKLSENPSAALPGVIRLKNAVINLRVHKGKLEISCTVLDATPSGTEAKGRKMWAQDGLELFIDLNPLEFAAFHAERYTANTLRIFYLPHLPQGQRLAVWANSDSPVKAHEITLSQETKSAGGYCAAIRIPLKRGEKTVGFDVKENDALPNGKVASDSWTGCPLRHRDRTLFGILNISEKKGQ